MALAEDGAVLVITLDRPEVLNTIDRAMSVGPVAAIERTGLPEVRRGLVAAGGGERRLAQKLPTRVAKELLSTGRTIAVSEAARWGLFDPVVPPGAALGVAMEPAHEIAANASGALIERLTVDVLGIPSAPGGRGMCPRCAGSGPGRAWVP